MKGKLRGRITIAGTNRTGIARATARRHAAPLPFISPQMRSTALNVEPGGRHCIYGTSIETRLIQAMIARMRAARRRAVIH